MKNAIWLVVWQALMAVVVALAMLAINTVAAYSALLGGLICVIPNAWFASRLLLKAGRGDSRAFLRAAYVGEAVKLIMTAALFALVFVRVKPLHAPALFIGFAACILMNWIGLIFRLDFLGRDRTESVQTPTAADDWEDDGK